MFDFSKQILTSVFVLKIVVGSYFKTENLSNIEKQNIRLSNKHFLTQTILSAKQFVSQKRQQDSELRKLRTKALGF